MTIGARIKQRRAALGLSQAVLAGRVEAHHSMIGYWESGHRNPGKRVLPVLADALDVSPEWLATGKAPPRPGFMPAIPFHPLADLFPLMVGADFDALVADMKAIGFRAGEEIVIHEGMILDGRNRCRAAIAAGIIKADEKYSDHFRQYGTPENEWDNKTGSVADPLAFVLAKNLHRRHLSVSQRAIVAAKMADLPPGRPAKPGEKEKTPPNGGVSAATAAKVLNVGPRTVERARQVVETAAPEVVQAVTDGQMTVASAANIASLAPERQREIVEAADPKVLAAITRDARAKKTAAKKIRRAEREAGMAAKVLALPERRFGVIYADPEWEHKPWSEAGLAGAAVNHYPVSSLDTIKARLTTDFEHDIRADDCALFLWSTVPHLAQALEVMSAWGFEYKTSAVWVKDYAGARQGLGYWFRVNHEVLLVGTRGTVPSPAPGENFGSVFTLAPGAHSEKPGEIAEMIETHFPTVPKIELNARAARAGWTCVIHDPDAGSRVVGPDGEVAA